MLAKRIQKSFRTASGEGCLLAMEQGLAKALRSRASYLITGIMGARRPFGSARMHACSPMRSVTRNGLT